MELQVDRKYKKADYTISRLYVNGKYFCDCLEDTDRGLKSSMPLAKIKEIKKAKITAIPTGTYNINMGTISPKYSLKPWYLKNCHGARVPRLENVPGYSGILIHIGNTAKDTDGCLLVGKNDVKGMVTDSTNTFLRLYTLMYNAYKNGEKIKIVIG